MLHNSVVYESNNVVFTTFYDAFRIWAYTFAGLMVV